MARKVAIINMKGGVGKSTLAANLAWKISDAPWYKKVLVIDLDPQFNCSQYLVGASRMERIFANNAPTVRDIFADPGLSASDSALSKAITHVRPTLHYREGIDLIPSQPELSQILRNPAGKELLLKRAVDLIESRYGLVIVDCPPTESLFITAAYLAADYILVPVRPQFLDTIGLPLLEKSLNEFEEMYPGEAPKFLGIAFNAVRSIKSRSAQESSQIVKVKRVANQKKWNIFRTEIVNSESFTRGSEQGNPISSTSYVRGNVEHNFDEFAQEFARNIGLRRKRR